MAMKVYDLAKEYGIPSKDFTKMLQDADIPVKNHMSNLTEQQEKYFRNNYDVIDSKVYKKGTKPEAPKPVAPKEAPKAATQAKPSNTSVRKPSERPAEKPAERANNTRNQSERPNNTDRPRRDNGSNPNYKGQPRSNDDRGNRDNRNGDRPRNNNYQNRDGQDRPRNNYNGQNRDGQPRNNNYQNRDGQDRPRNNYNGQNGQGNRQYQPRDGQSRPARDGQPRNNYQNRDGQDRPRNNFNGQNGQPGGYRNNNGQSRGFNNNGRTNDRPYQRNNDYQSKDGGFQDKDNDKPSYNNQRNTRRPQAGAATADRPVEKKNTRKADSRNVSKAKNDQKNKNHENFYEDKGFTGLDNTKKSRGSKSEYKKKKLESWEERATSGVTGTVILPDSITVADLSEKIRLSAGDIIKTLMSYGIMANINQSLDFDTASTICEELGITVELEEEIDVYDVMEEEHFKNEEALKLRPPIVTVMGHVDHGKTSLLDAIKNTNVIAGEAGGITQHIGAYSVVLNGQSITFIDTPGHAAFTAMRSRGASVTDIAVLVVAADDGVMPQTIEAINHAKAAGVPVVVAVNKCDKPEANPDKVKQQLTEYGLVAEEWGGDTICVNISAKKNMGIDDLLENILLVAEVEELKANYELPGIGTIIEARLDKLRGVTATALIKSGIVKDGDYLVVGTVYGKIRVMTDYLGNKIKQAGPSMAVEIIGLPEVPHAGEKFYISKNEKEAKSVVEHRIERERLVKMRSNGPISLDDLFNQINKGDLKELSVIVKADVQGSLEAIKQSLEKLNDNKDNIHLNVIHGGVGAVNETDVTLASASNAIILAFNVVADANAKAASTRDGIEIRFYSVIYDMLEEIQAAMVGMLDPEFEETVTANADVRQIFKVPGIGNICGSYVTSGTVTRQDKVRVIRDGRIIFDGNVASLRRVKDDVKEVSAGYECGIGIEKYNDVKEGDSLLFYKVVEKKREGSLDI